MMHRAPPVLSDFRTKMREDEPCTVVYSVPLVEFNSVAY